MKKFLLKNKMATWRVSKDHEIEFSDRGTVCYLHLFDSESKIDISYPLAADQPHYITCYDKKCNTMHLAVLDEKIIPGLKPNRKYHYVYNDMSVSKENWTASFEFPLEKIIINIGTSKHPFIIADMKVENPVSFLKFVRIVKFYLTRELTKKEIERFEQFWRSTPGFWGSLKNEKTYADLAYNDEPFLYLTYNSKIKQLFVQGSE